MNDLCIRNEHMKQRTYFISAMCGLSMYNWANYSLFDPPITDFGTPYYYNCLLMLFYLGWDIYQMTMSINKKILYRTDLMIHHIVCCVVYLSYINYVTLVASHVLIMECISLMNYIWRNNPNLLKVYRTFCIFVIRLPISFWFWFYCNPIISQYVIATYSYYISLYLCTMGNIFLFFIVYDLFILWKIYKPNKQITS